MGIKISQLTAKGSNLQSTDLLEIAQSSGIDYDSKSITGQDIIDAIDTVYTADGTLADHRNIDGNNKDLELSNLNTFSVNALGLGAGTPDDMILLNINAANVSASGRIFNVVDGNASASRLAVLKNGDLQINGTISTQSNGNITIEPNGTGDVYLNSDLVSVGDNNANVTITSRGTGDLLLTTNNAGANQGVIRIYDGSNANIELTPHGRGAVIINIAKDTAKTAAYTLVLNDNCNLIEMNTAGAVNLTVPTNAAEPFPNGAQILIAQYGAGQVTIVPDTGVTLRSSGGKTKIAAQYGIATLIKRATDEWYLAGDLTT